MPRLPEHPNLQPGRDLPDAEPLCTKAGHFIAVEVRRPSLDATSRERLGLAAAVLTLASISAAAENAPVWLKDLTRINLPRYDRKVNVVVLLNEELCRLPDLRAKSCAISACMANPLSLFSRNTQIPDVGFSRGKCLSQTAH